MTSFTMVCVIVLSSSLTYLRQKHSMQMLIFHSKHKCAQVHTHLQAHPSHSAMSICRHTQEEPRRDIQNHTYGHIYAHANKPTIRNPRLSTLRPPEKFFFFFGGTGLFELRCTSVFSAASMIQGSNWCWGGMIIFYQAMCSRLRQVNHRGLLSTDTEEALVSFTDSSRWSPPWRGPV